MQYDVDIQNVSVQINNVTTPYTIFGVYVRITLEGIMRHMPHYNGAFRKPGFTPSTSSCLRESVMNLTYPHDHAETLFYEIDSLLTEIGRLQGNHLRIIRPTDTTPAQYQENPELRMTP